MQQSWAAKVGTLNQLDESRLSDFLFGIDRTPLDAIRPALLELQSGACFYCRKPIRGTAHVDHFIPWSRHPDDSLLNLVAADSACNGAKSDFVAASRHLERWHHRAASDRHTLHQVADTQAWTASDRILGVARAIYLGLPRDGRLWLDKRDFEVVDRERMAAILGAA